jgi:hypothetical protein
MRFDHQQKPISYMRGVLINGARPFLYRSRACSLLGVPDSKIGKQRHPQISPSIDFLSTDHIIQSEPHAIKYSMSEIERLGLTSKSNHGTDLSKKVNFNLFHCNNISLAEKEITVNKNVVQEKPTTAIKDVFPIDPSLPSKATSEMISSMSSIESDIKIQQSTEKQNLVSGNSINAVGKYHDPDTQTKNASNLGNKSAIDVKMERIEIPGVSSVSQIIPRSVQFDRGSNANNTIEGHKQKEVSVVSNDPLFSDVVTKISDNYHLIQSTKINIPNKKIIKKRSINALINDAQKPPIIDVSVTPEIIGRDAGHNESTFLQKAQIPVHVKKIKDTYSSLSGDVTNSPFSHQTVNSRSNENAVERIEQLRYVVKELAPKISLCETIDGTATIEDHKQRHGWMEQTQSQPIQKIVVFKQLPHQIKTPCAFWERSYLGRFRLRLLR